METIRTENLDENNKLTIEKLGESSYRVVSYKKKYSIFGKSKWVKSNFALDYMTGLFGQTIAYSKYITFDNTRIANKWLDFLSEKYKTNNSFIEVNPEVSRLGLNGPEYVKYLNMNKFEKFLVRNKIKSI